MFKLKFILIYFILVLLITTTAYAIGISPSYVEVESAPFLEKEVNVTMLNNVGQDITVELAVEGEMGKYVAMPEDRFLFIPNGGRAYFAYKLVLPAEPEPPGENTVYISAVERSAPLDVTGSVAVLTAVKSILKINVPYPGKYAEIGFNVQDVKKGEPVSFDISVTNRGKEVIDSFWGTIKVFSGNLQVATIEIPVMHDIGLLEKKIAQVKWADDAAVGKYQAVADFQYDGKKKNITKGFNVGIENLEILNFTRNFESKRVNPFKILVRSEWNYLIPNVYADILITQNGTKIAAIKSNNQDVTPWDVSELGAFWDATFVKPGEYDAKVTVNYLGRTSEAYGRLTVVEGKAMLVEVPKMAVSPVVIVLVVLVIIATMINILFMLKKKKGDKEK